MKLPALLISDLHLVSAPSCAYRWDLFPWLLKQVREHGVKTIVCLGDITDAKDNHSAELVNRVVSEFAQLAKACDIRIIPGNHDWLRRGQEFFKFLACIDGIEFFDKPAEDPDNLLPGTPSAYYLPFTKSPAKDWAGFDFSHYDYVFMHQTAPGSVASNGEAMAGEELPALNAGKVYSGDIHVPQVIGNIEYVGSPYHVHFGDAFKPRCILIQRTRRPLDLHFETISRVTVRVPSVRELKRKEFRSGDQVKLRIELGADERHGWAAIRRDASRWLADQGVVIAAIELVAAKDETRRRLEANRAERKSAPAAIEQFVLAEGLGGSVLEAGLQILEAD